MKELQEVFDFQEDLFRPTEERNIPFKLKINKIIYLNKKQYYLMIEEFLKEKKERFINSRCLIPAKIGNLKRCIDGKCEECQFFKMPHNGTNNLMLDTLEEHGNMSVKK